MSSISLGFEDLSFIGVRIPGGLKAGAHPCHPKQVDTW
jgi:hypothetical protein